MQDGSPKIKLELERSRGRIVDIRRELKAIEERLAGLPGLEETQKRFQEAGVEERLKEKSLLIREERVFAIVAERLDPIRTLHKDLAEGLPLDAAFVSPKALEGLPNAAILAEIESILSVLSANLQSVADQIAKLLADADIALANTKARWSERRKIIEETYEKLLRELQKSKIDGAEFIRLREQIEGLRPLRERTDALNRELAANNSRRRNLLSEWEDIKAIEYREIQSAAKKVSRKLRERVRVEVTMAGNREPLEQLLREVGGNLSAALDRLRAVDQLSLPDLAQRCREGKDALMQHYGMPPGSAERIAQANPELFMRIEELDLPATTMIELNTAAGGGTCNLAKSRSAVYGPKGNCCAAAALT